jgi:long-chain fatty acid transport protein
MKTNFLRLSLLSSLLFASVPIHASTEGDNLIGVGAGARALGGTGVAAPTDVTGAIADNPAGLGLLPATQRLEVDANVTDFLPHVSANVGGVAARSASKNYPVPSLSIAGPLDSKEGSWLYGFAAYGVTGLGVDYIGTSIDTALAPTAFPLVAGTRTELKLGEVAPALAYRISPQWTVGLAVQAQYGRLDLGDGGRHGYGVGVEPGLTLKPTEGLTLGVSYVSAKPITYKNVTDFDGNGTLDNLKLTSPQEVKFGLGYEILPGRLHLSSEVNWVNWGGAAGYADFGWKNSWDYALGLDYTAIPGKLELRVGYNFGDNPVKAENGFNGAGAPANVTVVQGKNVPNYYYQTFRVIGFPAIVDQHLSFGVEYHVTAQVAIDAGYTHSFKNTITETGTNLLGNPVTLSSSLSEDSIELGVRYSF